MFENLIQARAAMQEAIRIMIAGPRPKWPWSEDPETYRAQQMRRARVQGLGMRFADLWRASADDVRRVVAERPDLFPEFHIVPKKGDVPDPTSYSHAQSIVARIEENGL